jgi:UDP:flavonoid glycosyltransferase YjiC (YdhE family)
VVGLPPRVRPPVRDGVIITGPLPHEWAFPQVDVVIHHAGAGTTAAAVRAGRPSVPVPVLGDQYLWARRLHQLGVAPAPVRGRDLSASSITDAVRAALVPTVRERAAALGRTVAAEDGVRATVDLIHRYAGIPTDARVP